MRWKYKTKSFKPKIYPYEETPDIASDSIEFYLSTKEVVDRKN